MRRIPVMDPTIVITLGLLSICSVLCSDDSASLPLPNIHYNFVESRIWTCPKSSESMLQSFEDTLNLHILSRNATTVSFLFSDSDEILNSLDNHCCYCHGETNWIRYNESHIRHKRSQALEFDQTEWFKSYHNLSTIYEWYEQLSTIYPNSMEFMSEIGYTSNNRAIVAVKLLNKRTPSSIQKPIIYLQCLLHAREWITGSVCMYIAYKFVSDTSNDLAQKILNSAEIIMIPVANPDGYELTWTNYPKYRLWRKNLSNTARQSNCLGVDLNRNFDIQWGIYGSSDDQCSETYHGSKPVSEKETKVITELLKQQNNHIIGALDFHSYSQAILYPPGWKTISPVDNVKLVQNIAQSMAKAASQRGTHYVTKQMGSIYVASGTFGDWVNEHVDHNDVKKIIPLTVELPPNDNDVNNFLNGFMIQPDKILSICEEMFDGVIEYMSLQIKNQDE